MNEESTTALIESLSEFTQAFQNEDFAKAIQLAPALLLLDAAAATQDDDDESLSLSAAIYECYIKALIHEEKFEDVLELWNPNNNINNKKQQQQHQQTGKKSSHHKNNNIQQPRPVPSSLEHLRIYALYRLERFEKSRELAATAAAATAGSKQPDDGDGGDSDNNIPEESTTTLLLLQKHLLAQSLFHLQQSAPAMDLYQEILEQTTTTGDAKKQQQQLLTNLAAVASANATPHVRDCNLLEKQHCAISTLLEKLGQAHDDDDDDDLSDLAYNLATYELLTSPTEIHKWQQVLQKAIHAVIVTTGDDNNNEKEAALIKSNLDWSSRFWNGNCVAASATGAAAAVPMNQLSSSAKLVALTNRALSMMMHNNDDPKTVANALRLVPATTENNLTNVLTPLQMRLVTYNRALLQYRAGQYSDCRASCQMVLDSSARTSSGSKKKRGGATTTAESNAGGAAANISMIAQPTLDAADAAWWESRIVVVQTLCHKAESAAAAAADAKGEKNGSGNNGQKDKDNTNDNLLQTTLEKISKLPTSPIRDSAVAYLQLHQAALLEQEQKNDEVKKKSNNTTTIHDTIALLKSLPESMQNRRAVVATLASLHQQLNQPDQVQQLLEEMGDDSAYADFLMGQQQYQQAADLYQKAAADELKKKNDASNGGAGNDDKDYLTAQARYIKALSFVDPQKAQELWLQIRPSVNMENDGTSITISGADLEMRELPRLKSSHATRTTAADAPTGAAAAAALSKTAATAAEGKPKKSRDAVLRQRARKREAYVAQLDKKGLRHVPNPDPERWLPKYERSYNRRRRHRNQQQQQQQHKGAQGGISEKDAAKLDVAARQAARNDPGAADGITATSTAQTAVSTGGPRKGGRRR